MEKLKHTPFCLCQVEENEKHIIVYYLNDKVLSDYNDVAHYLATAIELFRRVRNQQAGWLNLENLWTLRNCIRENYNHGLELDALIFGGQFDGRNPDTVTPLTMERFNKVVKAIRERDPYASV